MPWKTNSWQVERGLVCPDCRTPGLVSFRIWVSGKRKRETKRMRCAICAAKWSEAAGTLLALVLMLWAAVAPAQTMSRQIQSGEAGGLQFKYIVGPGGCTKSEPCQIVEYLHYLGGEGQVENDLNSYFNTPNFWGAHPNTIVVAPQVNGSSDTNNWGGVQAGVSDNGKAAVAAVKQIESQYATNPNTVVLTGGSMGGIGTEALMLAYGPNGSTGEHVYAAGLAIDGALYNSNSSQEKQALCGVSMTVQHGTADSTVNPGPDNKLAQTLSGCPGFNYVQVQGAGHGTWGETYSNGSLLSQVMAEANGQLTAREWADPGVRSQGPDSPPQDAPKAATDQMSNGGVCTAIDLKGGGKTLGQFSTSGGKIYGLDGKEFFARGVSVLDATLDKFVGSNGQPLLTMFPGTNFVRIAVNAGYNPDVGDKAVLALTHLGIVVVFTNYNQLPLGSQTEISGADLKQATDWYAALATKYSDNPLVWFTSLNEPTNTGGSIAEEQKAVYEAIRGTGNNNIVMFDLPGGGPSTNGLDTSIYGSMHNVVWDDHFYGWMGKGSTDPAVYQQAMDKEIADSQAIHSADGPMPVIVGEWGDSTNGNDIDPGWEAVAAVVTKYPNAAWVMDWPGSGADRLVASNSLTPLGQKVAEGMAASPSPTPSTLNDCAMPGDHQVAGDGQAPPTDQQDPAKLVKNALDQNGGNGADLRQSTTDDLIAAAQEQLKQAAVFRASTTTADDPAIQPLLHGAEAEIRAAELLQQQEPKGK